MFGSTDLLVQRGLKTLEIASDPSGFVTAILSRQCAVRGKVGVSCVLSIWLNTYGLVEVGRLQLQRTGTGGVDTQSSSIIWHPRGKRLCVCVDGDCFIVTLAWQDSQNPASTVPLSRVFQSEDALTDSRDTTPESPVKVKLTCIWTNNADNSNNTAETSTKHVITSACLYDSLQYLFVGLAGGKVAKCSWHGGLKATFTLCSQRELWRSWVKLTPPYAVRMETARVDMGDDAMGKDYVDGIKASGPEVSIEDKDRKDGQEQEQGSDTQGEGHGSHQKNEFCHVVGWSPALRGVGIVFGDGSFSMLFPDRVKKPETNKPPSSSDDSQTADKVAQKGSIAVGNDKDKDDNTSCLCVPKLHTVQLLSYTQQSVFPTPINSIHSTNSTTTTKQPFTSSFRLNQNENELQEMVSVGCPSSSLLLDSGGCTYLVQALATRHLPTEGHMGKGQQGVQNKGSGSSSNSHSSKSNLVVHTLLTTQLTLQKDTTGRGRALLGLRRVSTSTCSSFGFAGEVGAIAPRLVLAYQYAAVPAVLVLDGYTATCRNILGLEQMHFSVNLQTDAVKAVLNLNLAPSNHRFGVHAVAGLALGRLLLGVSAHDADTEENDKGDKGDKGASVFASTGTVPLNAAILVVNTPWSAGNSSTWASGASFSGQSDGAVGMGAAPGHAAPASAEGPVWVSPVDSRLYAYCPPLAGASVLELLKGEDEDQDDEEEEKKKEKEIEKEEPYGSILSGRGSDTGFGLGLGGVGSKVRLSEPVVLTGKFTQINLPKALRAELLMSGISAPEYTAGSGSSLTTSDVVFQGRYQGQADRRPVLCAHSQGGLGLASYLPR